MMLKLVREHPARVYAVAVAALALVAFYLPATPVVLILGLIASLLALGGGEVVQRTENAKTLGALYAPSPDDK